jgi:multidrug transporter EmrE-like cation transporter
MLLKSCLFLLYVAISCVGLYKLKVSRSLLDADFVVGTLFYGASFVMWLLILRFNPLSYAFPIASGSLIIATQFIGVYLLDESIGFTNLLGIFLIISGIILVYRSPTHG